MLAFKEEERKHAYGVYSGCPCLNKFEKNRSEYPLKLHPEDIEELKQRCEKYTQRYTCIHHNWNPRIKLPYGEWQDYTCYYDTGYGSMCAWSLKQEKEDDATFQDEYLKEL